MHRITVETPTKTEGLYQFSVLVDGQTISFGYRAQNFAIEHHAVWDSIYPLMFLVRNGGPVFGRIADDERFVVSFRYPILQEVADFYVARTRDLGYRLEIEASLYRETFDVSTGGHVLAFGGGKDSRLLYGLLVELGRDPQIYVGGDRFTGDLPAARRAEPIHGAMPDKLMPGLMARPARYYNGSGLGEIHKQRPWHQYYDISSPDALSGFSSLLARLGFRIDFEPAVCVLPYNLIQKILCLRYPELYRHQVSTPVGARSEKNLHVALLKRYHGISHESHLSPDGFRALSRKFVAKDEHEAFGFRRHREIITREMRSILSVLAESDGYLKKIVPAGWGEAWIDYVHPYAYPGLGQEFLDIYAEYADALPAEESPLRALLV